MCGTRNAQTRTVHLITGESEFFWNLETGSKEGLPRMPRHWLYLFLLGKDVVHGSGFGPKANRAWQVVNERIVITDCISYF